MRFLLDTTVCVDYLRGREPVVERMRATEPDAVCASSVVVAELRYGADKSSDPRRSHDLVDTLLREIDCLDFDSDAAAAYGQVRARLEAEGRLIGPNDLLIAAHALSLGVVLVTDNLEEFHRVEGLRVETWREGAQELPGRPQPGHREPY